MFRSEMATTSTINHQDIHQHHQGSGGISMTISSSLPPILQMPVTTICNSSPLDSDSAKGGSLCSESTAEDLIFFSHQSNPILDFLIEGDRSSRESLVNLLDEGLGTSLDGTEDLGTHTTTPTLGRNDSGVFSSDETIAAHSRLSLVGTATPQGQGGVSGSVTHSQVQAQIHKKIAHRVKTASPNRQGPQQCVTCGKTFSNASALTKHKLTHSDERKHTCTVCGKAFKRQDHLNGHMLTHRSKKPFECSSKGCGKSYCDARSLRRHVESRHGAEVLASMTIAPTPHTDAEYDIIIPPTPKKKAKNANKNSNKEGKGHKKGKNVSSSSSCSSSCSPNSNPLLCQGSSSSGDSAEDENELLTSVENLLSMEDSSASNALLDRLDASLMEMGVIEEEMDAEIGEDEESSICDKLNNNDVTLSEESHPNLCCNSNNILKRPEDSQCQPQVTLGLPKPPHSIVSLSHSQAQSQLHQLLTQRAKESLTIGEAMNLMGLNLNMNQKEEEETHAVTLIKESLIASSSSPSSSSSTNNNSNNGVAKFVISTTPWPGHVNLGLEGIEMGKGVRGGILVQQSAGSTPQSLKEQLELIHQIFQQTTEETAAIVGGTGIGGGRNQQVVIRKVPIISEDQLHLNASCGVGLGGGLLKANHQSLPLSSLPKGSSGPGTSPTTLPQTLASSSSEEVVTTVSTTTASKADENKPVECAICCRRFKNTPALNGHMRLHGGYFKKETEGGRKKEPTAKETPSVPLQTASVSVRALIEEKIIQRRNAAGDKSGSSSASSTPKTTPPTTPTKKPTLTLLQQEAQQQQQRQLINPVTSISIPISSTTSPSNANTTQSLIASSSENNSLQVGQSPPCPIIKTEPTSVPEPMGLEEAVAEYLLVEEEVFNKVSSICPDSFFSGIDESLLCESGMIANGSDSSQLSASDFFNNWSSSNSNLSGSGGNGNGNGSAFFSGPGTPSATLSACSTESFTPLPTMDPVFFTPTPGSVHSHQDDLLGMGAESPSFIYPTPPASLESHNALQSPLFPFPFPFEASPQSHNSLMMSSTGGPSPSNSCTTSSSSCSSSSNNGSKSVSRNSNTITSFSSSNFLTPAGSISATANPNFLLTTVPQHQHQHQVSFLDQKFTLSGNSIMLDASATGGNLGSSSSSSLPAIDLKPVVPLPPLSPSSASGNSNNPSIQLMSMSLFDPQAFPAKGNETYPITADLLEAERIFRSPERSFISSNKKKQVFYKNTLASNLRPQGGQPTHFTPYPILSPVRSAPGLYWTFSCSKLAHIDGSRKERPRINQGSNFQAVIPPLQQGKCMESREDLLWSPDTVAHCFPEDVDKYLEFACCSAIPGGGMNKEYALHILNYCRGDINAAMLLLMNPSPILPLHLMNYKYPEIEQWSGAEVLQFQESLIRHFKDFRLVAQELGTKSREACVSFYQVWKKCCPQEYGRIRSIWKEKEAALTIEVLKTIPPPPKSPSGIQGRQSFGLSVSPLQTSHLNGDLKSSERNRFTNEKTKNAKQNNLVTSNSNASNTKGLEEFPCKICGKVFSKVKSRSAHMKSHRPPPTPPSTSPAPVLSPASAATLMENKEKIADALQKHIFGKKSLQANKDSCSMPTFIPKIVKVEAISPQNHQLITFPTTTPKNTNPTSAQHPQPLQIQAT